MLVRHFNKPRTVPYLRITVGTEDDVRRLIAAAVLILGHEQRLARAPGSLGTAREESDFYPYRYLASEGFLPGYNFPALPVRA